MRVVLLPFFLVRLALALSPFLLKVAWLYKAKWLVALVLLSLVGLRLIGVFNPPTIATDQGDTGPRFFDPKLAVRVSALPSDQQLQIPASPVRISLLAEKIGFWLEFQPNHRDLLIDQAILFKAQRQDQLATETVTAAQNLDPNSSLFE